MPSPVLGKEKNPGELPDESGAALLIDSRVAHKEPALHVNHTHTGEAQAIIGIITITYEAAALGTAGSPNHCSPSGMQIIHMMEISLLQ
ncbi:hypothetical protein EYF80_033818 [Liparis tanakae]|uniref:Uncharacterized protein n=1 Tax=Liparis tanakae TaxID=230148 RepID=A0A4Z2GT63_9TELE|nr:hypothetical protein EYF80_033818 [Liparis tanakae]